MNSHINHITMFKAGRSVSKKSSVNFSRTLFNKQRHLITWGNRLMINRITGLWRFIGHYNVISWFSTSFMYLVDNRFRFERNV